ncbi:hypothetical protein M116_0068 [Bacteroides fragilis str. 3719 A10]|uniref:Lipoprotein n=1 Tax=Bacteroides fragilis str. 3783N1-6 TaxID=1339310 RepID=A0AB73ARM5_BACFG|nr:hypothetical protein M121_0052 [Bacteroides fragilis str. 3783N2-1]EXY57864.1 hypothetical protein M122_0038 [Bacteroides fragilis str. 3976T7]EXZ60347.1 hypothetical protein M116_0068 [Bacteroides fragilis str. 3719 A10]EXZ70356.1 hypothetical protein M120_0091 [Bacteroides fragilis str. 3783N1-8]EYB11834.1 hypothetical protein M119_0091 [Bacteroides fragilis str. 3783N1-6]KXU50488.1 hypothetical protein HMPREF2530_00364 [Bacteroides fragilis]
MNIQTPLIQKLYSQCSSAIAAYCFFEKKPAIDVCFIKLQPMVIGLSLQ